MTQHDVYQFYQDYIKPLYCEIEAEGNELPVELLFEIHAAFDHLKRLHVDHEEESLCCHKAISHLKRGALDVFKLKLKYYNSDVDELLKCGADLGLIDNGNFIINLLADKTTIHNLAKNARLSESNHAPEYAFDAWCETSLKIDQFREDYLKHHDKFEWAKKKTFQWLNKDAIRGAVIGFLTGIASSLFAWWLTSTR